jgi:uncharacterized protein YkwD
MEEGKSMQRRSALVLSFLIALGTFLSVVRVGLAGPGQSAAQLTASNADASGYCATSEELEVLKLVNDYRKANGLGALKLTQTLGAASEHHSKSMADYGYFDHFLIPENIKWSTNMVNYGYDYNTWRGENIAAGSTTAARTFTLWKESPAHNKNMLSPNYKAIGVGHYYSANSKALHYWTTDFGGYVDAAAKTCPGSTDGGFTATKGALKIYNTGRTSNSRVARYCLDGRQDTSWYTIVTTPPSYAYVWFDLGSVKPINTVKWKFNRTGFADYFEIQVSNDRKSWTLLAQGGNAPSNTWQTLNRSTSARYVRFLFRNPNKDLRLGYLSEVRVYP